MRGSAGFRRQHVEEAIDERFIFRGHVPTSGAEWLKFFSGLTPGVDIGGQLGKVIGSNAFGDSGFGNIIRAYDEGTLILDVISRSSSSVRGLNGGEYVPTTRSPGKRSVSLCASRSGVPGAAP